MQQIFVIYQNEEKIKTEKTLNRTEKKDIITVTRTIFSKVYFVIEFI